MSQVLGSELEDNFNSNKLGNLFMKKKQSVTLKKSQMFKAISAVSQSKDVQPTYAELHEEDMEGFMDEHGRALRWQRLSESADPVYAKGRCWGRGERIYSDTEAVELVN